MAFWRQARDASQTTRPSPGPATPLTFLVGTGSHSLTESASLVRLRIDVPAAAASALSVDDDDGDEEAACRQADNAVRVIGKLHQVIRGIEQQADDARVASVLELLQDRSLQLLCSKAVVAKVYKSLIPHQATVGYSMAPAKACLSQKPVAAWDLEESLQTAVIKSLTGCSSGTPATNSTTGSSSTDPMDMTASAQGWMCLSRRKLLRCNLLAAAPGQVSTAPFVELEVKHDAACKGLLLMVHAAGSLKFRLFSPTQALQQDVKSLKAPLTPHDTDAELLADPGKLAAAARQLEGRAVKLLPDERLVFIKGLAAAPTDQSQLEHMSQYWLGCYGLLLPPSFLFLVGVATHPEAEAAQMQVPSCCVLTNLGLSTLPGSQPGGSTHTAAVSQLVSDLQAGAAGYSFWGNKLSVQLRDDSNTHAGSSQANLQLTQPTKPEGTTAAAAAVVQPKAYSLQTQWTSAADVLALQSQATKQPQAQQQQQQRQLTAAEAQLMGLVEAEGLWDADAAAQQPGSSRHGGGGTGGGNSSSIIDKDRWKGLKQFLAEREGQRQQQQQQQVTAPGGLFASARAPGSSSSLKAPGGSSTGAVAPVRTAGTAAVGGAGGVPAAPRFVSRKPGAASKPPAAAKAAAGAAGAKAAGGGGGARLLAALQAAKAQQPEAAAASGGAAAGGAAAAAVVAAPAMTGKPAAPSLGKRPAAAAGGAASAKPPAAKKAKPAAAAAGSAAAGAKPKAAKKATKGPAAAAAATAAPAAAAAGGEQVAAAAGTAAVAAGVGGSQPMVAEPQQQSQQQQQEKAKAKRTKASELDLAVVTAKVQAAFAASGGAALKGVSVPEMQCVLRARGVKGGPTKRADVEARLLALLSGGQPGPVVPAG